MTTVVVAPNAFKGSLTSLQAAAAMAAGVATVLPDADIVMRPIADGGDGSVDALLTAGYLARTIAVRGPVGGLHEATMALREGTVVVELANTCGVVLLGDRLAPMTSSTLGLGDAMHAALENHPASLVVCVGGSSSTDGGSGMLVALGARLLDSSGDELPPCGASLPHIDRIDLTGLDPRLASVDITIATDVTSPLLGEYGAARMFAAQKGADRQQVDALEAGLAHWARLLTDATGVEAATVPGAGAAGGTAFGAVAALGARIQSGADFIADAIGLEQALGDADLVLTGEGALDAQSLLGKGAASVARQARARHVPAVMVCGRIDLEPNALASLDLMSSGSLLDLVPADVAQRDAAALLARRTVEVLAAASATERLSGA